MFATDKITGNKVTIVNRRPQTTLRCMVIRHADGSEQIQFVTLLKNFTNK